MDAVAMQWNRELTDLCSQLGETLRRGFDQFIHVWFRKARPPESLGHDANAQPLGITGESLGVCLNLDIFLARVKAVLACNGFQQQGDIVGGGGNWPGMVEREFDGEHASVRDKAVGWLKAVGSAPGARDTNRTTQVATDRHIAFTGHNQCSAATG